MNNLPPILYEDKDIFVFNKPSGLMVHGDGKSSEPTLADMLLEKYPEMKEVGEPMTVIDPKTKEEVVIYRPGIVHRLDKETSGVIVVAKNQIAFEFLKDQFKNRKLKKTYRAIVWGNIKEETGRIDIPIGRSKNDFRKWLAGRGTRGTEREAVTEYKVLDRLTDKKGEACTYVEVYPKTGRTHQIRVHMKYKNHPILGDSLYAEKRPYALGLQRLALHAYEIELTLPSGKALSVTAPVPPEIESVLAKA